MRIAHVTDCYLPRLGGIEINVRELVKRQRAAGHDVMVITSTRALADLDDPRTVRVDQKTTYPGRIVYRRSRRASRVLCEGTYDLVHAHTSTFSPLAYLAARHAATSGIPAVLTVHSLWADSTPLFRMADIAMRWSRWPVTWTAVSEAAAAGPRSVLGNRAEVTVVPNGVDPCLWRVKPVSHSGDELRVVAVGRLAPRKRIMHFARFLLDARQRLPDSIRLSVEIVGDGPDRTPLEQFVRRHGMTEWVHMHGALDQADIRRVFARSDLFVAPAELESFGIAALEARCAGLPVLARSGTGVAEFVHDGVHGWLVGSDRQMAEMITSLALNRCRLERVAANNRAVAPGIDWPMVLGRYSELYLDAVSSHGRLRTMRTRTRLESALVDGI